MHVIQDFRKPLLAGCSIHVLDFLQIGYEGITVVVVACILLVKFGHSAGFILGADVIHVPIGYECEAVGIGKNQEENHIFSDEPCGPVFACDNIIGQLDGMLGRGGF